MIFGILSSLAAIIKVNLTKPEIDNAVFRLHRKWTMFLCFVAFVTVATNEFIGKPIECTESDDFVTTACWVKSTYTINTTLKDIRESFYWASGSNFFGIGTYLEDKHTKTFHAYYQWVPFVLFIQGVLFYVPYFIWKVIEGKQVEHLLQGLNIFSNSQSASEKIEKIVKYMRLTSGLNQKYCFSYMFCEVMNLCNVIGQMFMLDRFFGGLFLTYGYKVIFLPLLSDEIRSDPLVRTFPRMTKCEIYFFGSSGSLTNRDYLCILPQNLLNEKIFIIMWVWFAVLIYINLFQLIIRAVIMFSSRLRMKILEHNSKLPSSFELKDLERSMPLGDFFLLTTIGGNVDTLSYRDILEGMMADKLDRKTSASSANTSPSYNTLRQDMYHDETLEMKQRCKQSKREPSV